MTTLSTRRDILKGGLAVAGLGVFGIPDWVLPALAQGEDVVPFTDLPPNINLTPTADRRIIDIRRIDGPFTARDQFFTTQHYGHPEVDPAAFRLKIRDCGPPDLALAELRKMRSTGSSSDSSARAIAAPPGSLEQRRWTACRCERCWIRRA